MTRKKMIIKEIAYRKARKKAQDYIKKNCMNKTVKQAEEILHSPEFQELYNKCGTPMEAELPEKQIKDLSEKFLWFFFGDVFKSSMAKDNYWN